VLYALGPCPWSPALSTDACISRCPLLSLGREKLQSVPSGGGVAAAAPAAGGAAPAAGGAAAPAAKKEEPSEEDEVRCAVL
jgi:hypothetical protein